MKNVNMANVTDRWERDETVKLFVDLDSNSLNGVGIGMPIAKLSFLGPSDKTKNRDKSYSYGRFGIQISNQHEVLSSVFIAIDKGIMKKSYKGSWFFGGREISITKNTKCEYIEDLFGTPTDQWTDYMERCYTYQRNNVEIEFLWKKGWKLRYIGFRSIENRESRGQGKSVNV